MGPSKKNWAAIGQRLLKWGGALRHAVEEHGRPNSFGVSEIAQEYGLDPRDGYYLKVRLIDLWEYTGRDYPCPRYVKGRFVFDQNPGQEFGT